MSLFGHVVTRTPRESHWLVTVHHARRATLVVGLTLALAGRALFLSLTGGLPIVHCQGRLLGMRFRLFLLRLRNIFALGYLLLLVLGVGEMSSKGHDGELFNSVSFRIALVVAFGSVRIVPNFDFRHCRRTNATAAVGSSDRRHDDFICGA